MGDKGVVVQPAMSETRPDLAELMTQFFMRFYELKAQGGHTVAVMGSHR